MRPRSVLLLGVLGVLAAARASTAQAPPYPVIFVHGLNGEDRSWQSVLDAFDGLGWGEPYTYHADLNRSRSTRWQDDVVVAAPVRFRQHLRRSGADSTVRRLAPSAARATLSTRLFAVSFRSCYDASRDVVIVHCDRNERGQSDSNQAAAVKQGAALGIVVRDVLAQTGASQVILVGHSMGGLAIREYLQRRDDAGQPQWWADRADPSGHRTVAAVTYGTPHQGSNATAGGLKVLIGLDPNAEAVRDLKYTYVSSGETAPYLWGGPEDNHAWPAYHNDDVNADGDEDDVVTGLNVRHGEWADALASDHPALPLPTDVAYTYITSTTDIVVDGRRQALRALDADGNVVLGPAGAATQEISTSRAHWNQTEDVATLTRAITDLYAVHEAEAPVRGLSALSASPNPARTRTKVAWGLAAPGHVRLRLHDALGRSVRTVEIGDRAPGTHATPLDVTGLPAGLYLVVLTTDAGERLSTRVTVAR